MLFRSDRKSTRLNSSHTIISYAVFCLKKKKHTPPPPTNPHPPPRDHDTPRAPYPALPPPPLPWSPRLSAAHPFCRLSPIFFFNDTATTEIYTLSLHDALPI